MDPQSVGQGSKVGTHLETLEDLGNKQPRKFGNIPRVAYGSTCQYRSHVEQKQTLEVTVAAWQNDWI